MLWFSENQSLQALPLGEKSIEFWERKVLFFLATSVFGEFLRILTSDKIDEHNMGILQIAKKCQNWPKNKSVCIEKLNKDTNM